LLGDLVKVSDNHEIIKNSSNIPMTLSMLLVLSRGGLAIVAMWQCHEAFFFENAWHFKDIFREFEAFLKITILF
jgi:hypothetical protein